MEPEEALDLILNSDQDGLESAIDAGLSPSVAVAGQSLLHWALATSQPSIAAVLITAGAETKSLSVAHESPLMVACYMGCLQIVKALLNSSDGVNSADLEGRSPLMYGARSGSSEIIRALIDKGANICAMDSQGRNAAHWVLLDGDHVDALAVLIQGGVPLIASHQGLTPLEYAKQLGRVGCVSLLERKQDS